LYSISHACDYGAKVFRKDQVMAMEALKQELLTVPCNMNVHKHACKEVVEKGAKNKESQIVVLGSGHDLVGELLESRIQQISWNGSGLNLK
jgi:hypothetical protein